MTYRAHVVRDNKSRHHFWVYENSKGKLTNNVLLFPDEYTILETCASASIAAEKARQLNEI
ncbi:hypothetical protein KAR91_10175 [Candidatus Pacearchaeota archaeon]|nr:hypothetical protein [Candidatus Pacearchaeota archaeon]